ncbi:MAG TPA: hypothetical protein IAA46_10075 [Candidatus Gemmiger avium]|nr:hypothetical protein [Candidatus Gemmiger avium]
MAGLKQRLQAGEQILGTMVTTFTSPDIARLLQNAGFDYFIVDCEHGSFTTREVANILAEARAIGLPGLVRIPEMRREHALKFMEMGAAGLLLPNTESAEQARMLVDCTKYAPLGHRGVSLSRPHTDFKKVNGPAYMAQANADTLLLCQIESRAGVEHIEEILAVEGIDVAFIGPNDMTQDYGKLDHFDDPEIVAAFERVIAAARAAGKFSGVHFGSAAPLKPWLRRGMQCNLWNSDAGLLSLGAAAGLADLKGD